MLYLEKLYVHSLIMQVILRTSHKRLFNPPRWSIYTYINTFVIVIISHMIRW